MAFDYSKLRGRIKEKYGTQDRFAADLGISAASLSEKLNEKSDFTRKEVMTACIILDISLDDVRRYFFCERS